MRKARAVVRSLLPVELSQASRFNTSPTLTNKARAPTDSETNASVASMWRSLPFSEADFSFSVKIHFHSIGPERAERCCG